MEDRNETGYDKISLLRGTEADLKSMVDKIKAYELVIAEDTNKVFYKTENGELKLIASDLTIENKQRFRAIYGVDELYNIKEGKSWIVGNVAFDDATRKYYKCKVANTDNFIDLQKWGEVNFNSVPTPSAGDNSTRIATTGFINNAFSTHTLSVKGYQKLPGGLIMQWGSETKTGTYSFPIPFPNVCLNFTNSFNITHGTDAGAAGKATSNSKFTLSAPSGEVNLARSWFAIGY